MVNLISIDRLAERISGAEPHRRPAILIGAGCSAKAGVPTAREVIAAVRGKFPTAYADVKKQYGHDPSYQQVMSVLDSQEIDQIFDEPIKTANLNWAHIALASIMKSGAIETVLTTNFDNLLLRACAFIDLWPVIYDVASARPEIGANVDVLSGPTISHLHGQRAGYRRINSDDDGVGDDYGRSQGALVRDVWRDRPLLIVGYSGDADAIIDQLANVANPSSSVFWVGYKSPTPVEGAVRLEKEGVRVSYIDTNGADEFLVGLARKLEAFPPAILSRPFLHLRGVFDRIPRFENEAGKSEIDVVLEGAKRQVDVAETSQNRKNAEIDDLVLAGMYKIALQKYEALPAEDRGEIAEIASWASLSMGEEISNRIDESPVEAREYLFELAMEHFEKADLIDPNNFQVANKKGILLGKMAEREKGEKAVTIYRRAEEQFRRAMTQDPENEYVLNNMGQCVSGQAYWLRGEDRLKLYQEGLEFYERAHSINQKNTNILMNWGGALSSIAHVVEQDRASEYMEKAKQCLNDALTLTSEDFGVYVNLGLLMCDFAEMENGEASIALLIEAESAFKQALSLKPDSVLAVLNFADMYSRWASKASDQSSLALVDKAEHLFERARELDPCDIDVYLRWGLALLFSIPHRPEECVEECAEDALAKFAHAKELGHIFSDEFFETFGSLGLDLDVLLAVNSEE